MSVRGPGPGAPPRRGQTRRAVTLRSGIFAASLVYTSVPGCVRSTTLGSAADTAAEGAEADDAGTDTSSEGLDDGGQASGEGGDRGADHGDATGTATDDAGDDTGDEVGDDAADDADAGGIDDLASPPPDACEPLPGDSTCNGCLKQECCPELAACTLDPGCQCLSSCFDAGDPPSVCVVACGGPGPAPLAPILGCASVRCSSAC